MKTNAQEPTMMTQVGFETAASPHAFPPPLAGAASLDFVSPYLNRPLRRIEEVERGKQPKNGRNKPQEDRQADQERPPNRDSSSKKRP